MKIWWFIILLQSWTEKTRFGGSFQTINWPKDYSRKYWKIPPSTGTHASRLDFAKKWVAKSQSSFRKSWSPILDKVPQPYWVPRATKINIKEVISTDARYNITFCKLKWTNRFLVQWFLRLLRPPEDLRSKIFSSGLKKLTFKYPFFPQIIIAFMSQVKVSENCVLVKQKHLHNINSKIYGGYLQI